LEDGASEMNGWHETFNDAPGPDVVCGHLYLIASPPAPGDPPNACADCLREGSAWIELRRCLVCGQTCCCESSPRRHGFGHFQRTGHPVFASQSEGPAWGWCYADEIALSPDEA
jgi:monovalent cation/hydrogen antiporter